MEKSTSNSADYNPPPWSRDTPLLQAIQSGNLQQIKDLLARRKNDESRKRFVNIGNIYNNTPLQYAIILNSSKSIKNDIIELLLDNGARVLPANATIILDNKSTINSENFSKLIKSIKPTDFDVSDEYGDTPLARAIAHSNYNLAMDIIKYGANVNYRGVNTMYQLQYPPIAQISGFYGMSPKSVKIFKALLDAGADIQFVDERNITISILDLLENHIKYYTSKNVENTVNPQTKNQVKMRNILLKFIQKKIAKDRSYMFNMMNVVTKRNNLPQIPDSILINMSLKNNPYPDYLVTHIANKRNKDRPELTSPSSSKSKSSSK